MESTNTTRAPSVRAWCSIASSRVSPSTWTAPASTVNRSARSRIWSGDSSPDTYSVGTPACSSRAAHCSSSVDFPMPGSPPTNTTDPGTMPPPRTKSNSRRPVCQRSTPGPAPRADRRTGLPDGVAPVLSARPPVRPTASSTRVFHAPHASQRPPHLGCSAPQSVQRNTEPPLATGGLGGRFARRVIVEARVFLLEEQPDGSGGAVALLAHDQLRDPLDAFVRLGVRGAVVELLTIDETHDVGVLLDRPGLAQVRQLGAPVLAAPLLGGARELGQRHHRHVQLLGQGLERAGDERDLLLPALGVG